MDSPLIDLEGRVALVTGAGQGIGAEACRYMAAHGAKVVVNDYVLERAEAVAAEITAADGQAVGLQGDVTDLVGVEGLVASAAEAFGAIDVLVNNAGNAGADPSNLATKPFWEGDPTEWEPFLQVNLYGVLNCCRAVIPGMIEAGRGGRIVTVISDAARSGEQGLEVYSAAKAGAAGLTRSLARGLGRFGITANNVAVGATRSPTFADLLDNEAFAVPALRKYVIRRFGEPSDAAALITFLTSATSSWITGQTYAVNGGFTFSQ
jgi:3-oxoacyl-[acyl-carrier protein] reductase